jgi:Glycogen recognition site of AMP-activated protein kinase
MHPMNAFWRRRHSQRTFAIFSSWCGWLLGVLCFRFHEYKFIVDGEWRLDNTQPFMPDSLGNVNNLVYV